MSTKSHRTLTEQMAQHVQSWKQQKISRKLYYKQAGMSLHKFNYWIMKLRKEQHDLDVPKRTGFTQISEAATVSSMNPAFQVELPNGNRINFFGSLTPELFKLFL